jgi:hypothetical protein
MRGDCSTRARPFEHRLAPVAWSALLVLASLSVLGCRIWGNDVVKVTVVFSSSSADRRLTDLTVVAGGDKYSWDALHTGTVRNINLLPGPRDDRQLLFSYSLDGRQLYWDGPKVAAGAGYEIEITVDGDGHATSRHCLLPCDLK